MTAPYSVGTVATYTCNSGYELSTTGDEMRTCMDNGDGSGGSFGGSAPTCQCKCSKNNFLVKSEYIIISLLSLPQLCAHL